MALKKDPNDPTAKGGIRITVSDKAKKIFEKPAEPKTEESKKDETGKKKKD